MNRQDTKFVAVITAFVVVLGFTVWGLGFVNSAWKDSRCHTVSVISDYRIFNGTNTNDLYDVADHFVAYNGTTITHIVQEGWYLVKVAPDSIGALYPLLGLKLETLRVCK